MAKPNFTFWCPSGQGCGKRVVGLNFAQLHSKDCIDAKRFICWNCENQYSVEELEAYGNNMSRIYRQRINNKTHMSSIVAAGLNEW
jgi:hypothetical protein